MAEAIEPFEVNADDVRVTVHQKAACKVELRVKASPFLVKRARKDAVKVVSKGVSIPGFRKGKAPQEIIEKKYPHDLEKALHKAIADLAFVQAQKAAKIRVLNNNSPVSFDLKEHSEKGAELIFSFETEPTVPVVDAKLFQPEAIDRPPVTDKEIDEAIYQMRFFYANWNLVDRPIQEGDYIMIDLDTFEGDTPQRVFNHVRFEVSPVRMANWMKGLVLGAKTGDVLEGMSEPDETASEEEKKEFQPKKIRLSILKVEEAALPELNDEFAKKVGAADVAAMRESVANVLNQRADQSVQDILREQINDFLVQQYPFDLPQSLVDAEKKYRLQQILQDPPSKKRFEKMSEEEKKNLDARIDEESRQAVRLFYLSRQVVNQANLPITHKEIQDVAIATLQAHRQQKVDIDQIPKDVYALALSKVILAKAQDEILRLKK